MRGRRGLQVGPEKPRGASKAGRGWEERLQAPKSDSCHSLTAAARGQAEDSRNPGHLSQPHHYLVQGAGCGQEINVNQMDKQNSNTACSWERLRAFLSERRDLAVPQAPGQPGVDIASDGQGATWAYGNHVIGNIMQRI